MFQYEIEFLKNWIKRDEQFYDISSYPFEIEDIFNSKVLAANVVLKSKKVVLSGVSIISLLLREFQLKTGFLYKDTDFINNHEGKIKIGEIKGNAYNILLTERTILNILSLMSSIATKTYNLNNKIKEKGFKTKIAGTRKILPGIGYLQKLAIIHGGGDPHRLNLYDTVMIKDNHIAIYGSIENAIKKIKPFVSFTKKIEVEVENYDDGLKALKSGADIIMLDNFSPIDAKITAEKLKRIKPEVIIEVSGGINESNYLEYADKNIDIISMGCLTTAINYIDISLDIE